MQPLLTDKGNSVTGAAARTRGLTARLAEGEAARQDVFALRHKSYLAGGFIDKRPGALFSDPFDQRPNCQSIIVYQGARPVASVRVCVLDPARPDWADIPALHVFPDEIGAAMAGESRAIEINRLVRHPDFSADPVLVFVLFQLAGFMILRHGAGIVFSCVRKNHIPFYKRLKFTPIAGPRSYPELKFATSLLGCSRENYESVQQMMPLLEHRAGQPDFSHLLEGETVTVFARP